MSIEGQSDSKDRVIVGSIREVVGVLSAIAAVILALIAICGVVGTSAVNSYRVNLAEASVTASTARIAALEADSNACSAAW